MKKILKISKLDAARRQLETVIRLYFHHGDPVSIHTLTAASFNILRDINKHRGGEPTLYKDYFMKCVKKGHEKEVRDILNKAENFIKHADRDHEEVYDFCPEQTEHLLLEACDIYYKLTGEYLPLFRLYNTWFMTIHDNLFNLPKEIKDNINSNKALMLEYGKERYFKEAMPLMLKLGI